MTCTLLPPSKPRSPAGEFLLEAAASIQFCAVEAILEQLELEAIHHVWQLEYVDSHQWESMGVPIGLVSSIRSKLMRRQGSAKNIEHKRETRGELAVEMMRPRDLELFQATPTSSKQRTVPQEVLLSSKVSRIVPDITQPINATISPVKTRTREKNELARVASARSEVRGLPEEIVLTSNMSHRVSEITVPGGLGTSKDSVEQYAEQPMRCPQTPSGILSPHVSKDLLLLHPLSPLQQHESVDTYFPPVKPARQESQPPLSVLHSVGDDEDSKTEKTKTDHQSSTGTATTTRSQASDLPVASVDQSPVPPSRQTSAFTNQESSVSWLQSTVRTPTFRSGH